MILRGWARGLAGVAVLWVGCAALAHALPRFAQKENKPCAYCHQKPHGGGPRNQAGRWYASHGFSLAGWKAPAAKRPRTNAPSKASNQRKRGE